MEEYMNKNDNIKKNFVQIVQDLEKYKNEYVDEQYNCLFIEIVKENYKEQIMNFLNKYKEENGNNTNFVPDYVFDNLIYELKSDFVSYNEKKNQINDDKLDNCSTLVYSNRDNVFGEVKNLLSSAIGEMQDRMQDYNTTIFIENFALSLKQYLYETNPNISRSDIEGLNIILKENINECLKYAQQQTMKIFSKNAINEQLDHDVKQFNKSIDEINKENTVYNKKQLLIHAKFGLTIRLADEISESIKNGVITEDDIDDIITSSEKAVFISEDEFRNRIKNDIAKINTSAEERFNSDTDYLDKDSVFKYDQNGKEFTKNDNNDNLSIDDIFKNNFDGENLEEIDNSHNPELLKKAYSELFNNSVNNDNIDEYNIRKK